MWTMGIRTVFFIVAAVIHNWWSIPLIVLSVIMPWIAVVYANSGAERRTVPGTYLESRALPGPEGDEKNGQSDL